MSPSKGSTAGSAGTSDEGGAGGEDSATGGKSSKGGTSAKGGTSTKNSTARGGSSSTEGGTSATIGGASTVGGTSATTGGTSATAGGTPAIGGTSATTGGTSATAGGSPAIGGTSATAGGTPAIGGTSATTGGTSAVGIVIASPSLPTGKTYVAYSGTVTATGATSYSWSVASGSLPGGLTLQNTTGSTVTIGGTPTEAGVFPVKLAVTDGSKASTVDVQVAVTHKVAFLSDRVTSGVKELFVAEVGAESAAAVTRMNTPMTSGGVSSFTWSPDGAKLAYLVGTQLYVVNGSNPGGAVLASSGVSSYLWLNQGQSLAIGSTTGEVGVVDVSGASPWTTQKVGIPDLATGYSLAGFAFAPSPHARDFGVVRRSTLSSGAPYFESFHAAWNTGTTVTVGTLHSNGGGLSAPMYNFDGTLVHTSGVDGARMWDLSTASAPVNQYSLHPWAMVTPAWSPIANSILTTNLAATTDPYNLSRRTYSGSAWTTTSLFTSTSCQTAPGPWSPDGKQGIFTCNSDLRGIPSVATATVGSDVTLVPSDFATNAFTSINAYGWSPNSQWIALRADRYTSGVDDLFIVRFSSPGTAVRPYSVVTTPGVTTSQFSPNSAYVAYVGTLGTATMPGLYLSTLPSVGSPSNAIQVTASTSPAVQSDFAWLPGSRVLIYRANDSGGAQIHATHIAPSGTVSTPVDISGAYGTGVTSLQPAPMK